jgi:hypothetical protein
VTRINRTSEWVNKTRTKVPTFCHGAGSLAPMDEVQIQLFRTARHMSRAKVLVASLRARIEEMRAKGQSIDGAEAMLETFEATKRMLEEHERHLQAQLRDLRK